MLAFGSILNQRAYSSSLNFNDVPGVDDLNARGLLTVPLYAGGKERRRAQGGHREHRSRPAGQCRRPERPRLRGVARLLHGAQDAAVHPSRRGGGQVLTRPTLAIAKKRLEGGSLLKTDVLDIEVRLAQAREDLVRARNANALAVRALRNLLGIESGEFEVADTVPCRQCA